VFAECSDSNFASVPQRHQAQQSSHMPSHAISIFTRERLARMSHCGRARSARSSSVQVVTGPVPPVEVMPPTPPAPPVAATPPELQTSNALVSSTSVSRRGNATQACALTRVRPSIREPALASTRAARAPKAATATVTKLAITPSDACQICAWQNLRKTPGSTLEIRSLEFNQSKPHCAWR